MNLLVANGLRLRPINRIHICSTNVEHMNFATADSKQYAIATDYHLTNLFREFIIFRCKRETLRHDSKLARNCCPKLSHPLLCFLLSPNTATPFI